MSEKIQWVNYGDYFMASCDRCQKLILDTLRESTQVDTHLGDCNIDSIYNNHDINTIIKVFDLRSKFGYRNGRLSVWKFTNDARRKIIETLKCKKQ